MSCDDVVWGTWGTFWSRFCQEEASRWNEDSGRGRRNESRSRCSGCGVARAHTQTAAASTAHIAACTLSRSQVIIAPNHRLPVPRSRNRSALPLVASGATTDAFLCWRRRSPRGWRPLAVGGYFARLSLAAVCRCSRLGGCWVAVGGCCGVCMCVSVCDRRWRRLATAGSGARRRRLDQVRLRTVLPLRPPLLIQLVQLLRRLRSATRKYPPVKLETHTQLL